MLSTNYYIHLILDYDHDVHYTDTMLCLKSDAYLWYKLKSDYGFNVIIFAEKEDDLNNIMFSTWDDYSESFITEKKKFFGISKKADNSNAVRYSSVSMGNISFDYLLKFTKRNEIKKNKIAFVVSLEAMDALYKNSDAKTIERLKERIKNGEGNSIIAVKIPPKPLKISEAFLKEDAVLPKISRKIEKAVQGEREPIMEALERQMHQQIVYAYRIDDAVNMLICRAVQENSWDKSAEELKDIADYLEVCYNNYGQLITEPQRPGVSMFVKHSELYQLLCSNEFREKLEAQVHKLRSKYPMLSIKDAMKKEGLFPENEIKLTEIFEYDDPNVRNIKSLSLPDKLRTSGEWGKWSRQLEQIKRSFSTFWNKPINEDVAKFTDVYYEFVRKALRYADKDMLDDCFMLLQFCGEQLCSSGSKSELVNDILEVGEKMVKMSENIYNILSAHSTLKKNDIADVKYIDYINKYFELKIEESEGDIEKSLALEVEQKNLITFIRFRSSIRIYIENVMSKLKTYDVSYSDLEIYRKEIENITLSLLDDKNHGYENDDYLEDYYYTERYDYQNYQEKSRHQQKDSESREVWEDTQRPYSKGYKNKVPPKKEEPVEILDDDSIAEMWMSKTMYKD